MLVLTANINGALSLYPGVAKYDRRKATLSSINFVRQAYFPETQLDA